MSACRICSGTGFRIVKMGGETAASPCECRARELADALMARSGIPAPYDRCSFETFRTDHMVGDSVLFIGLTQSLRRCVRYAGWAMNKGTPGLLLFGPSGSGKTHLAVSVLRAVIARGAAGVFLDCGHMLSQIKDTFGTRGKAEAYGAAMESRVVVLDDLGAAPDSNWVRDTIGAVISWRYNESLPTIVTTTIPPQEFVDKFGARTASRLNQMCSLLRLPPGSEEFSKAKRRRK